MAQNFVTVGRAWRKLAQETGKQITLGIEPEPDGFVETTQELIGFLTGPVAKFDQRQRQSGDHTKRDDGFQPPR